MLEINTLAKRKKNSNYLKKTLIFLFLLLLSLIISCSAKTTCPKPYILVGNDCCLDKDGNNICDKDEGVVTSAITQGYVVKEKENCPFECCVSNDYKIKECQQDYECKSNKCIAVDTDGDGLTDIEEKVFGSNLRVFDTDSDGLNDFLEKQKGTNPNNQNTDEDRYKDSEDTDPTIKNSAVIDVSISNKDFNVNWLSLGLAFVGGGVINPDMVIAKPIATVKIMNSGNDYSSYLSYDVMFYIANTELTRFSINKGKVELNEQLSEVKSFEIKANQVPKILIDVITKQSTKWDVRIENVRYEKY